MANRTVAVLKTKRGNTGTGVLCPERVEAILARHNAELLDPAEGPCGYGGGGDFASSENERDIGGRRLRLVRERTAEM